MPRGTQSRQRKSKAMPQLNWKQDILQSLKKNTKKQKPPTHSSTAVSYDTFLEQMAQRKIQTNFVICSLTCQLKTGILLSLKDQHKTATLRPVCKCKIWCKEKYQITLNSSVLKQEAINFVKSEKVHSQEKIFRQERRVHSYYGILQI